MQRQITAGFPPVSSADSDRFQIVVPYRSHKLARAAIQHASNLAAGLNVVLKLVYVYVVPYGFSLDNPEVSPEHLTSQLGALAEESSIPVILEIVYARDWRQGFYQALGLRSTVLLKTPWWHWSGKTLANRLVKLGHHVLCVK